MQCNEIHELTTALRENGDKILDARSKLSLSTSLISKMNESFNHVLNHTEMYASPFHVLASSSNFIDQFLDLQLLYDFVQKTVALKILPDSETCLVDINLFRNLKLLEVHRISLNLIAGLRNLRSHLEYLICRHSINTLKEVLEYCGADKTNGFVWSELKQATFSYNNLDNLDASLQFTPWLRSIDLSHNHIHDVHSLNCLPNLRYLNLSFNAIETVPVFSGQLCNMLQVIVLRNNYIDDVEGLSLLVNLHELDLSHNCLVEHSCLKPLMNMPLLRKLQLRGNPLSYHPQHRSETAKYLHINVLTVEFWLENVVLSKFELRLVGALHPIYNLLERSSSFNSTTTANTVIPSCDNINKCSDGGGVCNSEENIWLESRTNNQESQGMQDSGFVAEQRPASPSECSIESPAQVLVVAEVHKSVSRPCSATSLESTNKLLEQTIKYCESDIEILSNPSQSSIEVLSNRSIPRCIQSSSAILTQTINEMSTNDDLKKSLEEMHRSL